MSKSPGVIFTLEFDEKWTTDYIQYIDDIDKENKEQIYPELNLENIEVSVDTLSNKITDKQEALIRKIYKVGKNQNLNLISSLEADKLIKGGIRFNYLDYIRDEEKNSNLNMVDQKENEISSVSFDNNYDFLPTNEFIKKNKDFEEAKNNKSLLWKGVFSFDDEFLKENNILKITSKGKRSIDDVALKKYTRASINEFIKKGDFIADNTVFMGGIHYNTDNIHVHFALAEKEATKTRGLVDKSTLEKTKSTLVNGMTRDIEIYKKLKILEEKIKAQQKKSLKVDKLTAQMKEIKELLPPKGRIQYNSRNISPELKEKVNKYIEMCLVDIEEYKAYISKLKIQEERQKKYYGKPSNSYLNTKKNRLFSELGNEILKSARDYRMDFDMNTDAREEKSLVDKMQTAVINEEVKVESDEDTMKFKEQTPKSEKTNQIKDIKNKQLVKRDLNLDSKKKKYNRRLNKKTINKMNRITKQMLRQKEREHEKFENALEF